MFLGVVSIVFRVFSFSFCGGFVSILNPSIYFQFVRAKKLPELGLFHYMVFVSFLLLCDDFYLSMVLLVHWFFLCGFYIFKGSKSTQR